MQRFMLAIRLALRDYWHDWRLTVCSVLALASIVTPLLILHGVHNGIVSTLRERLLTDPDVLTLKPEGSIAGGFSESFLSEIRTRPGVVFAVGNTRYTASQVRLMSDTATQLVRLDATGPDDPILKNAAVAVPRESGDEVVLSQRAANRLQVKAGDTVSARLERRSGRTIERRTHTMKVVGVVPMTVTGADIAWVPSGFMVAVQDFRDNISVMEYGWPGAHPASGAERHYASFRVNVRELTDVAPLTAWFAQNNLRMITKAKDIAAMQSIDAAFQKIVLLIAAAAGFGFVAFTFSSVSASVMRKARQLALLRLLGFQRTGLMLFPCVQVLMTGLLGTVVASAIYAVTAAAIASSFTTYVGPGIVHMQALEFVWVFLIVEMFSLTAAVVPAMRASSVEPSDVLRNTGS